MPITTEQIIPCEDGTVTDHELKRVITKIILEEPGIPLSSAIALGFRLGQKYPSATIYQSRINELTEVLNSIEPGKHKPFITANVREILDKYLPDNDDSISYSKMVGLFNEVAKKYYSKLFWTEEQILQAAIDGEVSLIDIKHVIKILKEKQTK